MHQLNLFQVVGLFFALAILWEFALKEFVSWLWWRFGIWQASGHISVSYVGLGVCALGIALCILLLYASINYGYTGRWF